MRKEGLRRLNVNGVLKFLGVSRSGYNSFKKRGINPTKTQIRKQRIMKLIKEIYHKSHEIYGAPKIWRELLKQGEKLSQKTVGNYMREMGIKAHYIRPYTVTTIDSDFDTRLKNILNSRFNPENPNSYWCTDITYISTDQGFCYLTTIMDLFSRRIISWRLSETLEAKWAIECVIEAKKTRRITRPMIIHSDRGSQYVSEGYLKALANIEASYSSKANPWHNACIESFHALIKREWIYRFKIKDYFMAYSLVFEYIEAFYNTVRSHSHCDYQSPKQYEDYYYSRLEQSYAKVI
ncbi:MAG: IS3 family transposase [Tissierellia bacterium]|nr:IS3 family transposase [Tissierellia bacterium]